MAVWPALARHMSNERAMVRGGLKGAMSVNGCALHWALGADGLACYDCLVLLRR